MQSGGYIYARTPTACVLLGWVSLRYRFLHPVRGAVQKEQPDTIDNSRAA